MRALGVRVKVRIRRGNDEVEDIAKANLGFETEEPSILISDRAYRELKLHLVKPEEVASKDFCRSTRILHYLGKVKVRIVEPDRLSEEIEANTYYYPGGGREECLLSDALMEALGMIILKPKVGYWRFKDDPPDRIRKSIIQVKKHN